MKPAAFLPVLLLAVAHVCDAAKVMDLAQFARFKGMTDLDYLRASELLRNPEPPSYNTAPVPAVTVNLDLAPKDRWTAVATQYKAQITAIVAWVKKQVPLSALLEDLLLDGFGVLDNLIGAPYADEIRGVAEATDNSVGSILLLNLFYDLTASCTSVVATSCKPNSPVYHARALDYGIPGLQNITVQVNFESNGTVAYRGITYCGYVGLLTGMRPHGFSISVDERDTKNGTLIDNIMVALLDQGKSIGLFVRDVLSEKTNFADALQMMQVTDLMAPVYLIMAGMTGNEGVVITRDRETPRDTWMLDAPDRFFVLETNYDHWMPAPSDDDRRGPGNQRMNASSYCNITGEYMFSHVVGKFPNLNSHTTYTALMVPATDTITALKQNL